MVKLLSSLCSILIISLFFSCDDDALLTPQTESECTGSYCSLTLPGSSKNNKYINPSIF